ncbi:MAG: bifunctional folylpolyglutamate synthase/dihydrofolate synthase, partial [Nitrospirae bacterium]
KLGLENTVRLLSCFGNPQNDFPSIHVAGTNGKGSTSAMTASILRSAGFKVGLFTSPHLVSFTERIRINNEEITENEVVELADEIREAASTMEDFSPTFFEVVTVMGFLYFKRKNVDLAVVETGMGGRLDATNVLVPEVSVITGISHDHKEFLGDTISAIAGEKAGIIKQVIPVVTALQEPTVMDIIEKKAREKGSDLFVYGRDFSVEAKSEDISGSVFDYFGDCKLKGISIPLAGRHQILNASLALKTSEVLIKRAAYYASRLTPAAVKAGLENIRWPGRLEFISDNPPIVIDGAHNPSASVVLADSLRKNFLKAYPGIILVMAIMSDKDIKGIMSPLLPLASEIIFTAPAYERAAQPEILARHAAALGFTNTHITGTVKDAIEMAIAKAEIRDLGLGVSRTNPQTLNPKPLILITGSFYTIGEAVEALGGKGVLSRLRETV